MEKKYVILSIEIAKYMSRQNSQALLVIANEVETDTHSFLARLFKKTHYTFSLNRNDGTLYLVYPYSEQYEEKLMEYAHKSERNEFISIDLNDFCDEDTLYKGEPIQSKIHKDIFRKIRNIPGRFSFRRELIEKKLTGEVAYNLFMQELDRLKKEGVSDSYFDDDLYDDDSEYDGFQENYIFKHKS